MRIQNHRIPPENHSSELLGQGPQATVQLPWKWLDPFLQSRGELTVSLYLFRESRREVPAPLCQARRQVVVASAEVFPDDTAVPVGEDDLFPSSPVISIDLVPFSPVPVSGGHLFPSPPVISTSGHVGFGAVFRSGIRCSARSTRREDETGFRRDHDFLLARKERSHRSSAGAHGASDYSALGPARRAAENGSGRGAAPDKGCVTEPVRLPVQGVWRGRERHGSAVGQCELRNRQRDRSRPLEPAGTDHVGDGS